MPLWVGFVLLARADDPTVATEADGTLVGRIFVPADESVVRSFLANPIDAIRLSPEVTEAQSTAEGGCAVVTVEAQGPWDALHYRARLCPTESGWRSTLLESEDFQRLDVEWQLEPTSGGTAVEYRVRSEIDLGIPQFLVRGGTERSIRGTLLALVHRVAGR